MNLKRTPTFAAGLKQVAFKLFISSLSIIALQLGCDNYIAITAAAHTNPVKKILVVSSHDNIILPAYTDFINGFKQSLQENSTAKFEISYECLDLLFHSQDPSFHKMVADILNERYANNQPDLIVLNANLTFLQDYCEQLFNNLPVITVYTKPDDEELTAPINHNLYYPRLNINKHLDVIKQLKPEVEEIYIIIGNSPLEQQPFKSLARHTVDANPIKLTILHDLNQAELIRTTSQLKGNTVILFLDFLMDAEQKPVDSLLLLQDIIKSAQVPVFGSQTIHLQTNIVGGYLLDIHKFGQTVALKAIEQLNYLPPHENNASFINSSSYLFNWHSLKRWDIDEDLLPAKAVILNKPDTFWDLYRDQIMYIIGLGVLLLIIQATLLIINRRKRQDTEREMERLDRLNLVGEMAASISHEIRNPLTTVRGYLQFMATKPQFSHSSESFSLLINELDRANEILTEFLTLAKDKPIELHSQSLNALVESLLPIIQADANLRGHTIIFQPGEINAILIDNKEIRQVILNLVMNGLDAMATHGRLTIRTCEIKDAVVLSVTDEGSGIPPEIAANIGTPFFTTKNKGTGLGLSVCFAITARHKGTLTFETNTQGTTFYLTLPLPHRINE